MFYSFFSHTVICPQTQTNMGGVAKKRTTFWQRRTNLAGQRRSLDYYSETETQPGIAKMPRSINKKKITVSVGCGILLLVNVLENPRQSYWQKKKKKEIHEVTARVRAATD